MWGAPTGAATPTGDVELVGAMPGANRKFSAPETEPTLAHRSGCCSPLRYDPKPPSDTPASARHDRPRPTGKCASTYGMSSSVRELPKRGAGVEYCGSAPPLA